MNIVGIICEYNPFHNGHKYHIDKIKELFPDSLIILCLNGYFMQRGEVSVLSKEEKVKLSLEYGIDLVVELPFIYGTQSADYFAYASVKILSSLGCTHLVFGSETEDIKMLNQIASKQLEKDFILKKEKTINYPSMLAKSLNQEKIIAPNDLLAISFLKEIQRNQYSLIPVPIKRTSSYHDLKSNKKVISASNIRNKLKEGKDIKKYIPFKDTQRFSKVDENKLFELLKYQIITNTHLNELLDVIEGLDNKLKKEILLSNNIEELIFHVKSKRYTYNRIQRMLIHVLTTLPNKIDNLSYIKILGFNKKGQQYIKKHKKEFLLPTSPIKDSFQYLYELKASLIYDMITNQNTYEFEKKNQPISKKEEAQIESSQK